MGARGLRAALGWVIVTPDQGQLCCTRPSWIRGLNGAGARRSKGPERRPDGTRNLTATPEKRHSERRIPVRWPPRTDRVLYKVLRTGPAEGE